MEDNRVPAIIVSTASTDANDSRMMRLGSRWRRGVIRTGL